MTQGGDFGVVRVLRTSSAAVNSLVSTAGAPHGQESRVSRLRGGVVCTVFFQIHLHRVTYYRRYLL